MKYLEPEPMLNSPSFAQSSARAGHSVPVYAYANNNPLHWTDANGLHINVSGGNGGTGYNQCGSDDADTCETKFHYLIHSCQKKRDQCGGSYGFDVDLSYAFITSYNHGADPNGQNKNGAPGFTLAQHEAEHASDIERAFSDAVINGVIQTDGFSTIGECISMRRHVADLLDAYNLGAWGTTGGIRDSQGF